MMISLSRFGHLLAFMISIVSSWKAAAQQIPLGSEKLVRLLDQELSGESAKRNLEFISRLHRVRGSADYNQAIDFIAGKLAAYNMNGIEIIKIPADGVTMYGTQKSRPAHNIDFGELWEQEKQNGGWVNKEKIADWESMPIVVAEDSENGDISADLVDIGNGTSAVDYVNKDLKGKLVLTSSQPDQVVILAIQQGGAAGIISCAQNQPTAWSIENQDLIRWGHLSTFSKVKTFAFMVSLKQAAVFRQKLQQVGTVHLHAKVVAAQTPGNYEILTATIEGSDATLKKEEIVFTCHLDHPRPGANDNTSGCVAILEIARTLNKLITDGRLERPGRTLRFIWSPEIEGTTALLNYRPEFAARAKYNIHLDMVGGGPETKAIFHVSRSAQSLPGFLYDIGTEFGRFVTQNSAGYASGEKYFYPLVSPEGGKEALHTILGEFHMGSDFEVWSEGSFKVPSIYLHDWPDRYIHTNYDVAANIDPTKLKRSSFIAGASGYFLASLTNKDIPAIIELVKRQVLTRASSMLAFCQSLPTEEQENTKYYFWLNELAAFNTLKSAATVKPETETAYLKYLSNLKSTIGGGAKAISSFNGAAVIYTRNPEPKGPMTVFGYDYFLDHYGVEKKPPALLNYNGLNGDGAEYAYEALNLVNGNNDVSAIRNQLSAEFGPVPIDIVSEYLEALASIGVLIKNHL